jgi:ATP-binding cassette, subfamily B, bacterial
MFRRLLGMLRPYSWHITCGFVCLILSTPAQLFGPLVWLYIVDEVIGNKRPEMLLPALGLMLAVHLVGAGLSTARTYILGIAGQRFVADLRGRLHAKLMRQSTAYLQDRRTGDLTARVIGDVDTLQDVVLNGVDNVIGNALSLLWVAGIIVWLNWKVGLLTLVPLVFVGLVVLFFNRRMPKLYRRVRDRLGDVSAHLQEHLLGNLIIKAFAREAFVEEQFRKQNAEYTREAMNGVKLRSMYFPSVITVGFFSSMVMVGVGAYYILQGEFTVGGLVAYRGYWWQLFSPVMTLAQVNEMLQRALASAGRVFDLLDAPEVVADAPDAKEIERVEGFIEFKGVGFAYHPERPVLKCVEFEARPGQQIGIVGPSGTGKSTVLGLLLRFFDPQTGAVCLDGHDLRALKQQSFRRHLAIVTQEPFLFNDTVRQNILFGRLDATAAEVEEAAAHANAHEFIRQLAQGYQTVIGERGVKLSGGQKQRLCIARAFLANPRVLLLDEATAAVEPESEALIQSALERLMEGRTTVIVTHRLSMVRNCDAILVLRDGQVVERGTHAELQALGGWYARTCALQLVGGNGGDELKD